jgi:hypothetical protein
MGTKRRIKGNRGGGRSRVAKVKKKIKEAGGGKGKAVKRCGKTYTSRVFDPSDSKRSCETKASLLTDFV